MKKVLVIGSVNMDYTYYVNDFPSPGETILGKGRYVQPGGKGENQAVALAKSHKVDCHFIGAIGDDSDGERIKKVLGEYGVHAHLKEYEDTETGNASITVNGESENEIIIVKGANGRITPEDIDVSLMKECDAVVLQNEIPEEVNAAAMRKAHELGKTVIYNPAPYREMKDEDLWEMVDYFVPNRIELRGYTGTDNPEKGAIILLGKGVKNILVTLGTEGSILINKDEKIKANAFKANAIDTVAAGDTFVGYFTAALVNGYPVKEAMTYASRASAITVSRKGSVVSIPFGEEVFC